MARSFENIFLRIATFLDSYCAGEGLDTNDYIEAINTHFGIQIPDNPMQPILTLGDMCDCIARLLPPSATMDPEAIWSHVQRITSDEMGVDASELTRAMRYVEDLCC